MSFEALLFYFLATVMVAASIAVVTLRNPVQCALSLVLTFFTCACLWLLLRAEFLAIALVLVYVGAVMVLFLFVVMMIDINTETLRRGFWKHFPLAALIGAVVALEMSYVLLGGFRLAEEPRVPAVLGQVAVQASNTRDLGILLYTQYLYPLEIAAVILLVAIVAAIALTLRERKDSKFVSASDQIRVKAQDRLEIVKVQATLRAQAPAVAGTEQNPSMPKGGGA